MWAPLGVGKLKQKVDMEVRECVSYTIYKVNVNCSGPFNTTTSFPLLIVGNTAGMSFASPCKCWLICARSCNAAHEVIFLTAKYILFSLSTAL